MHALSFTHEAGLLPGEMSIIGESFRTLAGIISLVKSRFSPKPIEIVTNNHRSDRVPCIVPQALISAMHPNHSQPSE